MNRKSLWSLTLAGTLLGAVAVGGCARKQVIVGTGTPPPAKVAEAPKPTPKPTPTPPPVTGAKEPAPPEPRRAPEPRPVTAALERIHFDFDKYVLVPAAEEILKKNADYLKQNAGAQITIEGHCDERGTIEYNLALGERRAKTAYQYLMDLGVDPNRMKTVSYGKEMPLDPRPGERGGGPARHLFSRLVCGYGTADRSTAGANRRPAGAGAAIGTVCCRSAVRWAGTGVGTA
jgi:peptidoglycan-associated lipoprotein